MKKDTYDIVADAVREFWHKLYPTDVVVYFWQKYEWSEDWEWCEELVECHSDSDYENMAFLYDFCEGQTEAQIVAIVPLSTLTEFYAREHKLKEREAELPSAKRKGKWIREPNCYYRCSECGEHYPSIQDNMSFNFCPNCGCRMKGE